MDFPFTDIVFIVQTIKTKTIPANKANFIAAVNKVITWALNFAIKTPVPPVVPGPLAMGEDCELEFLESLCTEENGTYKAINITPELVWSLVSAIITVALKALT